MSTILKAAPASLSNGWRVSRSNPLRRAVLWLADLLVIWQRRIEDREILRTMSPAQLSDIGLDPAVAVREADKPFWRV